MSYEAFKRRVSAVIAKAGGDLKVRFNSDADSGMHIASVSDGTTIVGKSSCMMVEVYWGTSHMAFASI